MRNPNPSAGLAGCRTIALFWANLSKIDSISERRAKLEQFYFDGIAGVPPVIDADNFGVTGGGIRTTQINTAGEAPRMYQFHVTKDCSSGKAGEGGGTRLMPPSSRRTGMPRSSS